MEEIHPSPPPDSHTPAKAESLAPPALRSSAGQPSWVCLSATDRGWFELSWSTTNPDTYDWVGLYPSTATPDSDYVSGAWQWASKGKSYRTSVAARPGYQARYLRWNNDLGKYEALRRTPPFAERAWANTVDMRNWMGKLLTPTASLADVTLPGTHDSAAWGTWVPAATTQGLSIADQLASGIRFLDIRLKLRDGVLYLYHGIVYLGLSFDDVLTTVKRFLDAHPTETVVMSINNEEEYSDQFALVLRDSYYARDRGRFWVDDRIPTYTQAVNQIVVMRRYRLPTAGNPFPQGFGLDLSNGWTDNGRAFVITYQSKNDPGVTVEAHVQDFYNTDDAVAKTAAVTAMIDAAVAGPRGDIYINFASAVGGIWGIPYPYGISQSVNPKLLQTLYSRGPRARFGWVPMDFPDYTPQLIYTLALSNASGTP